MTDIQTNAGNSADSASCHSVHMAGNRRQLLRAGIGAAGLILVAPALRWSRGEAAAQDRGTASGLSQAEELMVMALQHEHGAVIQYANHAGLLSHWVNPIFSKTFQEIIADEVDHAVTLVNALIARGVTPTLAVWPPRTGNGPRQLVLLDIAAEQSAVELYSEILEHDLEPALRTAVVAIRDAEILHRNIFNDLLEKV
ncbi:Ferritin-like domain-containing protein [Desulfonatronum zhilinae]|nr:Ferritin-like domain-containing protein [Desulfonatronum zhilinae]